MTEVTAVELDEIQVIVITYEVLMTGTRFDYKGIVSGKSADYVSGLIRVWTEDSPLTRLVDWSIVAYAPIPF